MRKEQQAPSIKFSLIISIIAGVLLPLFAALLVLCVMMQRTISSNIAESYQMMFDQNIREIDTAILQSNYVSSAMITYTENNGLLREYYQAGNAYERSVAAKKIRDMILNRNVINLASFGGEMILLMNDGLLISSEKAVETGLSLEGQAWLKKVREEKSNPYWDTAISALFDQLNPDNYVTYGRELTRYGQKVYGYALIALPKKLFFQSPDDIRYQKGRMFMFSSDERLLTGACEHYSEERLAEILQQWKANDQKNGNYDDCYVLGKRLSSCSNVVLYVGNRHAIFERSEQIFYYLWIFMAVITALSVAITWCISQYITKPILLLAGKIQQIEHIDTKKLVLEKNHFQETLELEHGMLRAKERIRILLEEVRHEAKMKEKARFDALKAQIKPHFLFNTLNAIHWKASINGDQEVAEVLSNLGVLLSETYKNDNELETIDNAIYILEAYVKIMEVRFGNKVEFFCVNSDELGEYLIPRFCLQPLVENSFIHGMSHTENGLIVLRGEQNGNDIELTLIDNGEGLHGKELDLSKESEDNKRGITGIGLSNIHKRIQTLYGPDYGLNIDTTVEIGFKISLRIPAMKREAKADESADSRR
ncbi:hypothetical protein DXB18_13240 [Clostridium sp. OM02-18AC]|uniref:sensor histidine kinase n=1 Tax=Clostridium sp. OM02-18AC TaxID=2292311 RepID=UPI000E4BCBBC|nr:histidine kinase [Clostridium sp. OM02-18AC]RHV63846.1 hypothetical protein DXB18_13240 [Clostridium sp. OM02-18AC]